MARHTDTVVQATREDFVASEGGRGDVEYWGSPVEDNVHSPTYLGLIVSYELLYYSTCTLSIVHSMFIPLLFIVE